MRRIVVRHKTKSDRSKDNEALIANVFRELRERGPAGVRYAAAKLGDGVTFMHIVEIDADDGANPLNELAAFKAFQKDIKDRCSEPPQANDLTVIGNYRVFSD
jgi:hypothetical protein